MFGEGECRVEIDRIMGIGKALRPAVSLQLLLKRDSWGRVWREQGEPAPSFLVTVFPYFSSPGGEDVWL